MKELARPLTRGQWSESAMRVLRERYLDRSRRFLYDEPTGGGQAGEWVGESPEDMCWRVASAIAAAEATWGKTAEQIHEVASQFYELIVDGLFMPNSPTLMNAGKDNGLQYSACFVLPVGDSMDDIFEAVKRAAIIHKSGGGTGFAFSRLRPKDTEVKSTGGKASGPVSFLRVFNGATEAVKQGGTRRGANMGILRVDHPDVLEFINCKLDGSIANFNISVAATDAFMQALALDGEYDLVDPHTHQPTGRLRAREVFDAIVQAAWRTGDPGLVFIDRVNNSPANPVPEMETIEATNPCGEQPLAPNDACNLGSINLDKFARADDPTAPIAWDELERAIRLSVRFLDDVIQVNPYPLPEILDEVHRNRRIGLGIMGWADMLIQLGIPYDSQEALDLADKVMEFITMIGRDESARLAEERGPFPNWSRSIYRDGRPVRNSTVTTIAPTGTISIIAGCSSGIEPLFAIAFSHIVGDRHLTFVNPHFETVAKQRGFYSPELMEKVAKHGTLHGIGEIPEDVRKVFVTAHEIVPEWHVRMQAAFQKHTDNGVSKTINLPNTATVEDVAQAYRLAYDLDCLGITVFRDGCKSAHGGQVLHVGTAAEAGSEGKGKMAAEGTAQVKVATTVKPRPRTLKGVTYRIDTPLGTGYVHVNQGSSGEPFEIFLNVGKAGSDVQADAEALGRLISLILRMPSPLSPRDRVHQIVKQLDRIGGRRDAGLGAARVRSIPDAVAQVLAEHVGLREPGEEHVREAREGRMKATDMCPDCQNFTLVFEEGCQKCHACGFSEC
ncbi:MAG TPA: vitamin B12-dependent ribonucleotide reductase [Candidatus Methylomirabilis sp.]|nr:vitamin B12-dependent ribonucleotide reductase [Candidatus Methylomirabilis sp.]HSB82364.1 vitamin B12-dependent ribonucleotide reductase [Candidatus Methylomirabilis sp.]